MNRDMIKAIESGDTMKFYKSREWMKKRIEVLERDNHECQMCKASGGFGRAQVVHHIKHLKDRPELGVSDDNLLSLCSSCHNEVHPERSWTGKGPKEKKFMSEERWE